MLVKFRPLRLYKTQFANLYPFVSAMYRVNWHPWLVIFEGNKGCEGNRVSYIYLHRMFIHNDEPIYPHI